MRPSGRAPNELREVKIARHYTEHAEGSVLVSFGKTQVICTASVIDGVPRFLKGTGSGWLTAEYGMLPRATHDRMDREAAKGKQSGRTQEIQRLIGRALRSIVDLKKIGEMTIILDCDVIQADGGTRTAAITGGCVALYDALSHLVRKKNLKGKVFKQLMGGISVGVYKGVPVLDLDYAEDSNAETDMNIVMNEEGGFIEIQGTAEKGAFSSAQFNEMLELAKTGITELMDIQRTVLGL